MKNKALEITLKLWIASAFLAATLITVAIFTPFDIIALTAGAFFTALVAVCTLIIIKIE